MDSYFSQGILKEVAPLETIRFTDPKQKWKIQICETLTNGNFVKFRVCLWYATDNANLSKLKMRTVIITSPDFSNTPAGYLRLILELDPILKPGSSLITLMQSKIPSKIRCGGDDGGF